MNRTLSSVKLVLFASTVAILAVLAVACGDGDNDGGATPQPATPTASPTRPAPTPIPGEADMAKIQPVIDALRTGDTAKLLALVKYTPVACADNVQGFPQPPKCGGKPAGTKVEVFHWASCEGGYALPSEMAPVVQNFNGKLFKVYKHATDKGTAEFPQGIYGVIVYTGNDSTAQNTGKLISLDADGKIVSFWTGCGARARDIDETRGAGATTVFIPQ